MPIYRHDGRLLYFAHVPKCAGSSIEDYLAGRFGPAAFQNRRFAPSSQKNWSRNSPQHIPASQLDKLFPKGFFDAQLAFVRDPLGRLRSAFHFHQTKRGKIDPTETFDSWMARIAGFDARAHATFDNHFMTQDSIVPEGAEVFRLEDGFDGFTAWLDAWTGSTHPGQVKRSLTGRYVKAAPAPETVALVQKLFRADYDRFGYAA